MKDVLDVSEETDPELRKKLSELCDKNSAVMLALIGPYVGVRVSPARIARATMGLSEEFGVETVIDQIHKHSKTGNLCLLVNSPGGGLASSYKVARALRKSFKRIRVFVPHIAASGGTLVAITGNEIVMGMMSQLTPLDPMSDDGRRTVSASSVLRGFEYATRFFQRMKPEEAPYTYKVLADKYDAVSIDEALSTSELMKEYIQEILKDAGYGKDKCEQIPERLVSGFLDHGEVINFDEAKALGLNVLERQNFAKEWNVLREWLSHYILQSADKHIIRYVLPKRRTSARKARTRGKSK
jgi:hypothetical protein